ncbi:hypothetical protein LUZ61_004485 [Rhynchospora tenuis]|uniref:SWIM-type domain-containing protein n=1 Tax=Rhynchospora tenuis TaxID=198213 RepID=A0AAD6ETV0_9POAL|nr:hypothetical protein LUZ61_004485 [Rhynchospora tenuis]
MSLTGFDLNIGFDVHMSPQTAIAAETWDSTEASFSHSTNTEDVVEQKSTETSNETDPASSSICIIPDPIPGIPAPVIGMEFVSKEEAWQFYSRYAYSVGFGASRNGGSSKNGKTVRETIRCHKGGETRGKTDKPVSERRRAVKKSGCQARILLRFNSAKEVWFIHNVVLGHNHELCPEYSYKLTSHRNLPYYVKKLLEINEHSGLPLIGNINAVMQMGGGAELCGYSERDARNHVGKVRRYNLKNGDAAAMMSYFREKQAVDPNFFYQCKFDEENRLELVFWSDSVSRAAYQYFGDALSFDATYLVNKFDLPVAPFVGVNHHGKTTVFGCAMMTCEDADSYIWIMSTFLQCMRGKAPSTIITDQSKAMTLAIEKCLPNTIHRFCLWHIMNKVPNKVPHDETVIKEIKSAVYNSLTIDQFESSWQNVITKSSLQEHPWLSEMYEKRSTWIPAYFKNHFWAGISTTQRSESMNSFLDKFVNSKTTLSQFVKQFEEALGKQRRTEIELDFQCVDGFPKTFTEEAVEDQFAGAYTHKMFYKFQKELLAVIGLKFNPCERLGGRRVYTIVEKKMGKNLEYKVDYNAEDQTYSCDCSLFQKVGIVCRHALLVYKQEDQEFVPSIYVLDRWSTHCKRNHLDAKSIAMRVNDRRETYNNLYSLLHGVFLDLIDYALLDEHTLKTVVDGMNDLRMSLCNSRESRGDGVGNVGSNVGESETGCSVVGADGDSNQAVKDPIKRRKRGRNPNQRWKSHEEIIRDKKKQKMKKLTQLEGNVNGGAGCSKVKRSKK